MVIPHGVLAVAVVYCLVFFSFKIKTILSKHISQQVCCGKHLQSDFFPYLQF